MRVLIDVSAIIYQTGVSRYTKNLIKGLISLGGDNQYVLFGSSLRRFKELGHTLKKIDENNFCQKRIFPFPPLLLNLLFNKIHQIPIEYFAGKANVFHSSDWTQPKSSAFRVTTVHDLSPIIYPKLTHPKIVDAHKARFYWVKKEADRIIVPSLSICDDLISLGIEKSKIRVIPEAVDSEIKAGKSADVSKVLNKYGIYGKYILMVGVGPRKNLETTIKVFQRLKTEIDIRLVVVGHLHQKISEVRGIKFLGHVPDTDIPYLYQGAKCLVYPSFYEGFGLPILEAYKLKTPVVTSNIGAMKELGADASVLVNPFEEESIYLGIKQAISTRNELIRKGLKKLKNYSWKKTAEKTIGVYNEYLH